jgi:hypothetical protein
MVRLRGRAPRGERLVDYAPHGHWKTITFVGSLRQRGMTAPFVFENQIRGLLKNVGLVIGRAKFNVFAVRAEELIEDRLELMAAVRPLLEARKEQQVGDLDRKVLKLARHDVQVRNRAWYRPDHRALFQGDDRRSDPLQAIKKCWRLCRIDDPTPCFGGDRLDGTHLEVW